MTDPISDEKPMVRHPAYFTFDERAAAEHGLHLYYFAPEGRSDPPYTTQLHVTAIIDVASDGTLAGIELIDYMPPPPARRLDPATVLSMAARIKAQDAELARLRAAIRSFDVGAYVDGYEFRGDEGDYTPNAAERELLVDAISGIIYEIEQAALAPAPKVEGETITPLAAYVFGYAKATDKQRFLISRSDNENEDSGYRRACLELIDAGCATWLSYHNQGLGIRLTGKPFDIIDRLATGEPKP